MSKSPRLIRQSSNQTFISCNNSFLFSAAPLIRAPTFLQKKCRVADGPYSGSGEFVSGYVVVKTESIDEALELAKTNPMLKIGGTIEIRQVFQPGDKE